MGRKLEALKRANREGTTYIIEATRAKLRKTREDPRIIWLMCFELVLIFCLLVAIIIYMDPEINLLPKGTPKVLNYIGFAVLLIAIIYIYKLIGLMHFPGLIKTRTPFFGKGKAAAKPAKGKKPRKGKMHKKPKKKKRRR